LPAHGYAKLASPCNKTVDLPHISAWQPLQNLLLLVLAVASVGNQEKKEEVERPQRKKGERKIEIRRRWREEASGGSINSDDNLT